jgi:hypothetical protein
VSYSYQHYSRSSQCPTHISIILAVLSVRLTSALFSQSSVSYSHQHYSRSPQCPTPHISIILSVLNVLLTSALFSQSSVSYSHQHYSRSPQCPTPHISIILAVLSVRLLTSALFSQSSVSDSSHQHSSRSCQCCCILSLIWAWNRHKLALAINKAWNRFERTLCLCFELSTLLEYYEKHFVTFLVTSNGTSPHKQFEAIDSQVMSKTRRTLTIQNLTWLYFFLRIYLFLCFLGFPE